MACDIARRQAGSYESSAACRVLSLLAGMHACAGGQPGVHALLLWQTGKMLSDCPACHIQGTAYRAQHAGQALRATAHCHGLQQADTATLLQAPCPNPTQLKLCVPCDMPSQTSGLTARHVSEGAHCSRQFAGTRGGQVPAWVPAPGCVSRRAHARCCTAAYSIPCNQCR